MVKDPSENVENTGDMGSISRSGRPQEEEMVSTPSILSGKTHGQRFMVGYSPWDYKDPDTAEHTQSVLSQSKNRERKRKGITVEDLL